MAPYLLLAASIVAVLSTGEMPSAAAKVSDCPTSGFKVGSICKADLSQLRPTQFVLGLLEVTCEVGHLEGMSSSKLDSYLEGKPVPAWGAPDGNLYVVDHHHLCRSLLDADIPKSSKRPYVNITGDLSGESDMAHFFDAMLKRQNLWLVGSNGEAPLAPTMLPSNFDRMSNDPYRSLAWMVRSNGGYEKLSVPFQDFMYANLFRQANLVPPPASLSLASGSRTGGGGGPGYPNWTLCQADEYNDYCFQMANQNQSAVVRGVVPQAMKIATGPGASSLPGWDKGTVDPAKCS